MKRTSFVSWKFFKQCVFASFPWAQPMRCQKNKIIASGQYLYLSPLIITPGSESSDPCTWERAHPARCRVEPARSGPRIPDSIHSRWSEASRMMDDMKLRRPLGDLTMNKQDRLKLVLQRKLEHSALRLAETTPLERRLRPSRPPNSATKRRC